MDLFLIKSITPVKFADKNVFLLWVVCVTYIEYRYELYSLCLNLKYQKVYTILHFFMHCYYSLDEYAHYIITPRR